MMIRGTQIGARLIATAVVVILLIASIGIGLTQCRSAKTAKKQAEVSAEQGQASIGAGAEAGNTLSNVMANDLATDAAVAAGQAGIRAAPEGQKAAATKRAACQMKAYRDSPQCKEQTR